MNIRLNKIGIVNDSNMLLNGLTIITGKNNSGKTTVGKTLYSLLDAVSNISAKSRRDRATYIINCLDEVVEELDFFRFLVRNYDFENQNIEQTNPSNYSSIVSLFEHDGWQNGSLNEIEEFAHNVQKDISTIDVESICKKEQVQFYLERVLEKRNDNASVTKIITEQLEKGNNILIELFEKLEKDPELVNYARESIDQTLNVEFSGQIQPASFNVESSSIEIYDNETCCFDVRIENNKVINNGNPVFFTTPYKKVFFVDDPFIIDTPEHAFGYYRWYGDFSETGSLLNTRSIISHNNKLKRILRSNRRPTILEQTMLDEATEKIKKKIDEIIPGTFEFSSKGDFYLKGETKLKISNMATGSKMFSIIKILLEKGELGKSTMLILDEPEAHLHPSWQNSFAEMIVLLVKELGVNILLTTHSSNFVLALDAFMRKYKIEDKTNFYKTDFVNDNTVDYICANDDINLIYEEFLHYLSEVKILRNECLRNSGDGYDV